MINMATLLEIHWSEVILRKIIAQARDCDSLYMGHDSKNGKRRMTFIVKMSGLLMTQS